MLLERSTRLPGEGAYLKFITLATLQTLPTLHSHDLPEILSALPSPLQTIDIYSTGASWDLNINSKNI